MEGRCSSSRFPILLFIFGCIAITTAQDPQDSTIRRLRKHLLTEYDVSARPVHNHENTTLVEIAFFPEHITDLNEKRAILTLEAWVYMGWQDDHLKWSPQDFSGLDKLRIPDREIWRPDIAVMEGRGSKIDPWHSVNVEVNSSGYVMWYPSATLDVICGDLDYTQFPDDTQTCTVTLGSWGSDASDIDIALHHSIISLDEYHPDNPQWKLVSASAKREEKRFDDADYEPFVFAEFELKLRRLHIKHSSLISVPDAVARILVLCMFWMSTLTRKLLLGCTALIILTSVAVGITENLPSPAAAPAALRKVTSGMALSVAAIIAEMIICAVAGLTLNLPSWMDNLYGSTICLLLNPSGEDPEKQDNKTDKVEIVDNASELRKRPQWPLLAAITDRILSVVFLVLLFSI